MRWAVARALSGLDTLVKEYEIGLAVLGKPESWDPRIDPIVRVEFSRIRQRLRDYWAGEGAEDPVIIEFPFRSYLPVFRWRVTVPEQVSAEAPPEVTGRAFHGRRWLSVLVLAPMVLGAVVFGAWRSIGPQAPMTTIAVLPFADVAPSGGHEYLNTGFAEELTNSLAMIGGLRVIAPASSFQFNGKKTDVRTIGRDLGAGAVVEGSIAGDGNRLHIAVQLNRASDNTQLWQARYDREADNIAGLDDEITRSVAAALGVRPARSVAEFDPGQPALDEYMKGIDAERKSDPASLRLAEAHYETAIRLAPRYARAHARLGSAYLGFSGQTGPDQQAELENARRELELAVSLDPKLPMATAGLALVNYLLNRDWPRAEVRFRRALELGPSSANHQTYAWALMTRGRFAESERHYREAIQLDPLNCLLRYNLATLFSRERKGEAAREELGSCLSRQPNWFLGRMALGYVELFDQRPEEGLSDLRRAANLAPGSAVMEPGIAIFYAETGHRSEALALLRKLESQIGTIKYVRYQLALASAYVDDRSRLFHWLSQSVDSHEQQAMSMRVDPVFAPYQQDPRMVALERRAGLIP